MYFSLRAGVAVDHGGTVDKHVDKYLETSIPGISAAATLCAGRTGRPANELASSVSPWPGARADYRARHSRPSGDI
jgi:hypothetical protein